MNSHPWHNVSIGADAPEVVNVVVEIPLSSYATYELDRDSGMLMLKRVLDASINYPANYGFIPGTYCGDGDPLAILVISKVEIVPMCLVEARVIGAMQLLDSGQRIDKIIAVAANDMSVDYLHDINDLSQHTVNELRSFFEAYKKAESKTVSIEAFQNRASALGVVEQAIVDYKTKLKQ